MRPIRPYLTLMLALSPLVAVAAAPIGAPGSTSLAVAFQVVTGAKNPIWHLRVRQNNPPGKPDVTTFSSFELVLKPFRSSKDFCRTYLVSMESPGIGVDTRNSYDADSSLYIARDPDGMSCMDLSFDEDYFAVSRPMTDRSVQHLLDVLREILSRWNKNPHRENEECPGKPVTVEQLDRIEVAPEPAGSGTVRYWLACSSKKAAAQAWQVFDVWLNDKDKLEGYRGNLYLE